MPNEYLKDTITEMELELNGRIAQVSLWNKLIKEYELKIIEIKTTLNYLKEIP
jgi:hypothetical protein